MSEQYYLYTVTGLREPFYAAVDLETGRAWTSPTREGAIRQARDEGIDGFLERTISRAQFLRALGIEDEPAHHIHHGPPHHAEAPPEAKSSPRSWFVAGSDDAQNDALPEKFSLPARLHGGKKSGKKFKGGSPFAARPIAPPGSSAAADGDDMLIIPSEHNAAAAPTPFTDVEPPVEGRDDEA